jgi:acetate kinase
MPAHAYTYPIPTELAEKYKIRRYGFHGTSHRYVSGKAIEYLGNPNAKIVTCHLGNGSSISAVDAGKCIDTSMGFTPLEGVIMGSRCGAVDPAIIPFLMEKENIPVDKMGDWMNKKCGFLGVSGISSDLREIEDAVNAGHEKATLACDILAYQIKKYIGGYAAAMNGLDCVVFTAGIGENNHDIRRRALENMSFYGIELDQEKNLQRGVTEISTENSRVKVLVIPTNEELVIASDTMRIASAK